MIPLSYRVSTAVVRSCMSCNNAVRQFNGELVKTIFRDFGCWRGFLVTNTFNDKDVQKIMISEQQFEHGDTTSSAVAAKKSQ
eukprot:COSAG01_NODE_7955_length_2976_cov_121.760514_3_plen_82_part_00